MKVVIRNTMEQAGLAGWQLLLALAVFLTGCGGRGLRNIGGDAAVASGGGGGTGGTETGGVGGVSSASSTGRTGGTTAQGGSGGAAVRGGSESTGGVGDAFSGGGASSTGGTGGGTGSPASQGGSGGGGQDGGAPDGETMASSPDALCQPADLWDAITSAMCGPRPVFCVCYPTPDGGGGAIQGVVNLDSEGRVVDNTRLSGANRQAWLDALANERWSCLADQAVPYSCSVGG